MSWDSNIYYNPEAFGLEVVGDIDVAYSHEFDMFVVWKDSDGGIHWAEDSGYSWPIPFGDHSRHTLSSGSVQECHKALDEWYDEEYRSEYYKSDYSDQVADLHRKLAEL
jgi:hypothetical protein